MIMPDNKVAVLLALVVASTNAFSLEPAAYQRMKKSNSDVLKIYLSALSEGLLYANTELQVAGKPKLYCPPPTLALRHENYLDFIDEELALRSTLSDVSQMPVGLALFRSLQRKFPCP